MGRGRPPELPGPSDQGTDSFRPLDVALRMGGSRLRPPSINSGADGSFVHNYFPSGVDDPVPIAALRVPSGLVRERLSSNVE